LRVRSAARRLAVALVGLALLLGADLAPAAPGHLLTGAAAQEPTATPAVAQEPTATPVAAQEPINTSAVAQGPTTPTGAPESTATPGAAQGPGASPAAQPPATSPSVAQEPTAVAGLAVAPLPLLTARPAGDGMQYSLTLALPPDRGLDEVRVELTLPAGSAVVEALEARPALLWLGADNGRATWRAAAPPNSYVGPFSVTVRGGRAGAVEARVTWSGPPAGEVRARLAAQLTPVGPAAPLAVSVQGSSVLETLGDSGVLAAVPDGAAGTPATWSVRVVGGEADPPASVEPGGWWAAVVEAVGPSLLAAPVVLLVPARQPVAPGAEARLYRQTDAGWQEVAARGVVAPDGLQIAIPVDVPGLYAAALPGYYRLQPAATDGSSAVRLAVPRAASQRCDAFRSCLLAGEPTAASACTVDQNLCVEQDAGPPLVTRVCTPQEAAHTCASQTAASPATVSGIAPRQR